MSASDTLRALRHACGLGQEQWAAFLGVGRKTVQRWEAGAALPDARAEAAILELCAERRVVDRLDLSGVLAQARLQRHAGLPPRAPAGVRLLGRADDVTAVTSALDVSRLVTLVGPAGVGKTTLAFGVADAIDPVPVSARVLLAPVPEVGMVLASIAAALSLRQTKDRSLRDTVVAGLRGSVLLVLDNCEHLPEIGELVDDLLRSCAGLRILATSRTPLRRPGEHIYAVEPLATAAAVELFERTARRMVPDFTITSGNRSVVTTLCERLDCLPLAVELTAPRVRVASPESLLANFDRHLEIARTRVPVEDERHVSLESAVAWSYDLLEEGPRRMFRSVGVFAGAFTADAAAAVAAGDVIDTMDDLEALLDHNLIRRADDTPHFSMLQTLRAFALAQLVGEDEMQVRAAAHAAYHRERAAADGDLLRGPEQRGAVARLDASYDDMRTAMVWLFANDANDGLALAVSLAPYWDTKSALTEARRWLGQALDTTDEAWFPRASALTWISYFAVLQGDLDAGERLSSGALELWTVHGIEAGRGYALLMLGVAAVERGDLDRADGLLTESVAAFERGGDSWGKARPLNNLGELARIRGELDVAERLHSQALAIVRDLGDLSSQPTMLCGLGHVQLARGESTAAAALAREAVEISEALGNRLGTASGLELLALAQVDADEPQAARLLAAAGTLRDELGAPVEARDRHLVDDARFRLERSGAWRAGAATQLDAVVREVSAERG